MITRVAHAYSLFYRTQNYCGRKVQGFEPDFEYQIVFCHTGMFNRNGLQFVYSPQMSTWIDHLNSVQSLDAELNIYTSRHKKASAAAAAALATM